MKTRSLTCLMAMAVCFTATTAVADRPNVLFIAVDDLRPELGCMGSPLVKTPHIDALAKRSVIFERAYCQQAVCNPSRVSLLTGMRPDSTKVWDLVTEFRDVHPEVTTLPQHFKNNGYRTLGYGKVFHNPWPDHISWSEPHQWPKNSRLWSDHAKDELAEFKERLRKEGKPERAINRLRAQATEQVDLADSEHIDGAIADQAIAAMARLSKLDRPFFLAAGFVRPHLPFVVPRKYWDLYHRNEIPLAENASPPQNAPAFAMNTMYELRDYYDYLETPGPLEGALTEAQQRELKHGYYAAVSFVDAQIGRILSELDRLNLRDNTIIVLWGDHGWKLGEHRSWCKQTNYEIDTRVPLLIHDPTITTQGQVCKAVVESLGVYATLCDLTGLSVPHHVEGKSLVPLLRDPNCEWSDRAMSQFPRRTKERELMGYALRSEQYRYIEWLDRKTCETVATELYDHSHDPDETKNVSDEANYHDLVVQQSELLWETIKRPKPGDLEKPQIAEPKPVRPRLQFRNDRKQAEEVFWLAPDGRRVSQGKIAPGQTLSINTTLGHRFQIGNQDGEVHIATKMLQVVLIQLKSND